MSDLGRAYVFWIQAVFLGVNVGVSYLLWLSKSWVANCFLCVEQLFYMMCAVTHFNCAIADPGAVKADFGFECARDSAERWCNICERPKPLRTHHCSSCAKCVKMMDHHCMLINNCVGAGNRKLFLQMLMYIMVFCALVCLEAVATMLACNPVRFPDPHVGVISVLVSLAAVWGGCFAKGLLEEQIERLRMNQTGIEILQDRQRGEHRPLREGLEEVMGGPFSLSWFFPVLCNVRPGTVQARTSLRSELLGKTV